jgi:hypothetical protein
MGEGEEGRDEVVDDGMDGPAACVDVFRCGERVVVCMGSIELRVSGGSGGGMRGRDGDEAPAGTVPMKTRCARSVWA